MKKALICLAVAVIISVFASVAVAGGSIDTNDYKDRMAFVVEGNLLVYINFPFIVPSGNCGQALSVYTYEQSYNFPYFTPSKWELLESGTLANRGIYWFKNTEAKCSPSVVIEGHPGDMDVYGLWTGLEVQPEDLGTLSTKRKYGNVFSLDTDDNKFSYNIIFNPYGFKVNLGTILSSPSFNMNCDSGGVVLPNQRGFLNRVVIWDEMEAGQLAVFMRNTVVNRDEIFVLICREHY